MICSRQIDSQSNFFLISSEFKLTDDLKTDIRKAQENLRNAVSNLDMQYLKYERYGKNYLKKKKISPDSFMQLAFQVSETIVSVRSNFEKL